MSKTILTSTIIVAFFLCVTLCSIGILMAQPSSDNYILKKWAISSGGGSASSANYQAIMVIGQSSPPGTSSSANYTLYSGYLQPIFAAGAPGSPVVWVWADSANVHLDWDDVPDATSYNIYRANNPGVTVVPGNLIGSSPTSEYIDTGVVVDSVKFFYLITADN